MTNKKSKLIVLAALVCGLHNSQAGDAGTPKWQTPFATGSLNFGGIWGSPAVSSNAPNVIYVTATDGFLYAINAATGQAASGWSQPLDIHNIRAYGGIGDELICSPVIASDGTIYVASGDGNLYSINPNRSINWTLLVGLTSAGSIAIGPDGTLYVAYDDYDNVVAVNTSGSGSIKWRLDIFNAIGHGVYVDSPLTVGPDGTIYFYEPDANGCYLIAVVDQGCNGAVKWATNIGPLGEEDNDFHTSPVLDNTGRIYAPYGLHSTNIVALNVTNGEFILGPFAIPNGAAFQGTPAIASDGTVYLGSSDGRLHAISALGLLKWTFDTLSGQPIETSPAIAADGTIYFGGHDGRLWSVKDAGTSATFKWKYPGAGQSPLAGHIRSSPLIAGTDNAIYFGCDDGNVYSIFASAPLTNSPSPMFRKDIQHTASSAPPTSQQPGWRVGVQMTGIPDIYKGLTDFGVPYGGYTWFTITRSSCTQSINTPLSVTFFLGGDGTAFSTPYYNYNPYYAYSGLDFTADGCNVAPFPNGFYVNMAAGQAQATIGIHTVDSYIEDTQTLLLVIPPNGALYQPDGAGQATAYIHPYPY